MALEGREAASGPVGLDVAGAVPGGEPATVMYDRLASPNLEADRNGVGRAEPILTPTDPGDRTMLRTSVPCARARVAARAPDQAIKPVAPDGHAPSSSPRTTAGEPGKLLTPLPGADTLRWRIAAGEPPVEVWIYAGALSVGGRPARRSDSRMHVLDVAPDTLPRRYRWPELDSFDALIFASDMHPNYRALLVDAVLCCRPTWLGIIDVTAGRFAPMASLDLAAARSAS